ncbi:protein-glutamate O-methyltransferase [Aureimonas sp. ME7]|uniref:CheR family methyltransferase n=1 Tax=Aureimonas sp. ME7 TaxID=2744252 RepID=UPI0015F370FB|nr:protein-glutamate O-methyltransferase [Aureimonas sp. ME7]
MAQPLGASIASSSADASVDGEFRMTDKDFLLIAKVLYEDSGIALPSSKSALVYSRLAKRLRALGLASFKDYCSLITSHAGASERVTMLAALTTNVTHFFREPHHFDHLRKTLLPPLLDNARRGGRVRIWSAGCSKGHEPYSIGLTILDMMPNAADYDIRILASDIDPNVVEFGREGLYDDEALKPVSSELKRKWFTREGGEFRVADELKALVAFRELNLIGQWPMKGRFDAIFCRNVTIYFDEPTRQRIWGRFTQLLEPRAFVYIGHSERMAGAAAEQTTLVGNTIYQLN